MFKFFLNPLFITTRIAYNKGLDYAKLDSKNIVKFRLELTDDETYSLTTNKDIIRYYGSPAICFRGARFSSINGHLERSRPTLVWASYPN